jgi:hypothetical protein
MTFGFDCPQCGAEMEADIEIDSWGSPGNTCGPYESSYPAEGGEWHTATDPRCEACGHVVTDDALAALHEDRIQQRIAEPSDDYYEDY